MKPMNRRGLLKKTGSMALGMFAGAPTVLKCMNGGNKKEMIMTPLDYGRSFLLGKWPENEVRFWLESRTRIIDERDGRTEDYYQCASCKSEDTFAEKDLFYEDNYDYLPIFGPDFGLVYRRKAWLNPNYRSCERTEDMFGGPIYHLIESHSPEELITPEDVLKATHQWYPIVAQTEIRNGTTGLRAVIEYPVKTMNTRKRGIVFQVDTGPIIYPELGQRSGRLVDTISLAFVAFNAPHFADFVVEVPTAIGSSQETDDTQIYHYSRRISLAAENRLYALT